MTTTTQHQQQTTPGERLLDVRGVAERLGVGVRMVWKLVSQGRMPAPLKLGRLSRWRAAAIDAWIAGGCGG